MELPPRAVGCPTTIDGSRSRLPWLIGPGTKVLVTGVPRPCPTKVPRRMETWKQSPVLQFAVSGLLATIAIGLIAVAVISRAGRTEAIRDAKQATRLAGEGIIAPAVTPGVTQGDPAALQRLDRLGAATG